MIVYSASPLELPDSNNIAVLVEARIIGLIDILTVIMYCVNIILKWINNFKEFWNNKWNIFELVITLVVKEAICALTSASGLLYAGCSAVCV